MTRNQAWIFALIASVQYCARSSSQGNQARKRNKSIQIRKKEVKLSLFADDMVLSVGNPEESIKLESLKSGPYFQSTSKHEGGQCK